MYTAIAAARLSVSNGNSMVKDSSGAIPLSSQVFGSVFASINQPAPAAPAIQPPDEKQTALVQELLSLLKMDHMTETEGGLEFAKALVMGEADVTRHPLLTQLAQSGSLKESINKLLKELGVEQSEEESAEKDKTDLAEIVSLILPVSQMEWKDLGKVNFDSMSDVIKYAKLMVLSADFTDMAREEEGLIKKLNELLKSVASTLESEAVLLSEKTSGNQPASPIKSVPNMLQEVYTRMNQGANLENQKNVSISGSELPPPASAFHMPVSKVELFVLNLEKSGQPVNQEQFIKQFENMLAKANFTSLNGTQKLFIRLNPEHLGSLRIEIIQRDSLVTARIIASTSQAKEALESHIQNLKHAFSAQNIGVEKLEISQAMSQFTGERFLQKEHQHHDQQQPFEQDIQDEEISEGSGDFNKSFEEALVNMEV
ncbi:flagellar hook-length control protein FliK [Peribacillus deserti]|uniref:Flagellar hook-length control protein FliK n=1 Tax=Peribacillus deserti TaxID=673318 RepID=A0ABS2QGN3_9BACI|nr:flagellar hook-length control protein FliK [Peribacillus deserti]MBM7692262.1 flagellar hook-length control protein FliK [Peribacillus deserti]